MSEHITGNEFRQYFGMVLSGAPSEDDAEFVDEIDAHVAGCQHCFEKMQTVRYLMQSFSSSPELADSLLGAEFPETLARPAFDIKKVFPGVKVAKAELAGKLQVLADTVSGRMHAVFAPCNPALASARGEDGPGIGMDRNAINDLLYSAMEVPLEEGRKITLRCRSMGSSDKIRLFVYSNFEVSFQLTSGERVLCPVKSDYDRLSDEYVCVYELDGDEFELTLA